MQLLSIGVSDKLDLIKSKLQEQYNRLNNPNISLDVEQLSDETNYLVCKIKDSNDNMGLISENIRLTTINVLADYIINQYETRLIDKIISSNYCYFNTGERMEILKIALKSLKDTDSKNILNSLYVIRRKNIIIRKLIEYFEFNSVINIDGFVTFRLQDYIKDLEDIVEKAVDDYLMEREYREFIRLLKYFVEVQEPKFDLVHVIVRVDNKYMLLDGQQEEITNQCIQDFMTEVNEGEINYDDLLVSSLITLAPENVVIHGVNKMKNKELLETIKSVFSGKVIICSECELCKEAILAKK